MKKIPEDYDPYRCFGRHLSWRAQQWIGWSALVLMGLIALLFWDF